jgi:hypothetical protein
LLWEQDFCNLNKQTNKQTKQQQQQQQQQQLELELYRIALGKDSC